VEVEDVLKSSPRKNLGWKSICMMRMRMRMRMTFGLATRSPSLQGTPLMGPKSLKISLKRSSIYRNFPKII